MTYDPTNGRFATLDPFPGELDWPQSLHRYTYAHNDPVNGADPSGLFFSYVGAAISISVRQVLGNPNVQSGLNGLDKALTLKDLAEFVGTLIVSGSANPALAAGLLISVVPFGGLFRRAKAVFNAGGDLINGGRGVVNGTSDLITQAAKGFESSGALAGRELTEAVGEFGAVVTAKKLGMTPIENFPVRYRGIDGVYRKGDKIIVVEAKGGSATLGDTAVGQQMSQAWLLRQIQKLRDRGYGQWADELENAIPHNVQGMIVTTKIDDAGKAADPEFVLKNWTDIGNDVF